MVEGGLIVLCSFISPYRAERDMVRALVEDARRRSRSTPMLIPHKRFLSSYLCGDTPGGAQEARPC
jgi:Adenylylsulphate kinase